MEGLTNYILYGGLIVLGCFIFWFFAKGFDSWIEENQFKKFERILRDIENWSTSLTRKDMKWWNRIGDFYVDDKGKYLSDDKYEALQERCRKALSQFHEILKFKETLHKDEFEKLMSEKRIEKFDKKTAAWKKFHNDDDDYGKFLNEQREKYLKDKK